MPWSPSTITVNFHGLCFDTTTSSRKWDVLASAFSADSFIFSFKSIETKRGLAVPSKTNSIRIDAKLRHFLGSAKKNEEISGEISSLAEQFFFSPEQLYNPRA